jgi:hypothetical protein
VLHRQIDEGQLAAADGDVVERQDFREIRAPMRSRRSIRQSAIQRSAFSSEYCATCTMARMSSS